MSTFSPRKNAFTANTRSALVVIGLFLVSLTCVPTAWAQTSTNATTTSAGIKPNLVINIPTVQFSDVTGQNNEMSLPWLAQYIAGVYKYAVAIGAFLAAIMVIVGGFIYLTAGESSRTQKAKTIITDAILGLVVLLGSYTLLYVVNPQLTSLKPITIPTVEQDLFETGFSEQHFSSDSGVNSTNDPSLVDVRKLYQSEQPVGIKDHVCCRGTKDTWEKLKKTAEIIYAKGCTIVYAGGWGRTGKQQLDGVKGQKKGILSSQCHIFYHCTVSMGQWCSTKQTEAEACQEASKKCKFTDANTPDKSQKPYCDIDTVMHTTAVDAWAIETSKVTGSISKDRAYICGSNNKACAQDRCQRELIRAWTSLGGGLLVQRSQDISSRGFESWHLCVTAQEPWCTKNADAVYQKNGYGFPSN